MSTLRRKVEKMHSDAVIRIEHLATSIEAYSVVNDIVNANLCLARKGTMEVVLTRLEECLKCEDND